MASKYRLELTILKLAAQSMAINQAEVSSEEDFSVDDQAPSGGDRPGMYRHLHCPTPWLAP